MIYAKDRILAELDSAGAQLASLAADLKAGRAVLQARLKRPPPFMPLEEYDCHFANAFTHIEKAKMATVITKNCFLNFTPPIFTYSLD